ncbi:MAG: tyrosine-protein phosphatase [Caldilineaceae bacterium]
MIAQQLGQRHLPLPGAYNIRDIGGYPTGDGRATRWRTFLRADALHRLPPASQQALIDYGVRTIIDLRSEQECGQAPNVFVSAQRVRYLHVPLFDGGAPLADRLAPPNVADIYRQILEWRQSAVKAVFDALTDNTFPVLVHCTAGKDRTGLIAALMLGLAGVDDATIAEDYALTTHYAAGLFDELRARAVAAGRDMATFEHFLEANPESMLSVLAYVHETYGGVAGYLKHIGITKMQIHYLRQIINEAGSIDKQN